MYSMIIGNMLPESYGDIDSAMNMCFEIFPDAEFKGWNENLSESWLDIISDNMIVGKIIER